MRLIVCLLALGLLAGCDRQKQEAPQAPAVEQLTTSGLDRSLKGESAPTTIFRDPDGKNANIGQFAGKPVLVNLWASWCAPCIKELPTLERLEAEQAATGKLAVIAVSQDQAPSASVDAFLQSKGIGRFAAWHDEKMALTDALSVQIMPTTVLYDANGKEVWRYVGDMDWTGAEARKLLAEAGTAG